jgi:hypothetical protein
MIGGAGNDTYVVDNAGDMITENANEGTDTVLASVSYSLGANLENLTLTGAAAINGTGNALANIITGNASDNVLDGGAGADTMIGGAGNDSYYVDNAGDVITENANEGTDTVFASLSWTLGANLENLTLTGSAAINGTGNALANILTGNAGNNVLDGGAGADQMIGGLGDDTYVVDNAGDVIVENANGGTDTVLASVSWTLGANLENLTLTGSSAIGGTGNGLANTLIGNAGNNVLDGGAGSDTLTGGGGSDTFLFSAGPNQAGFGSDVVTDFGAGDKIVLSGLVLSSFQDLQGHMTQSGADTIISFGSGAGASSITLQNVQASSLTADQFLIAPADRFGAATGTLVNNFGVGAGGWVSEDLYPRHVADMNGDGYADIVGFGYVGTWISYGSANGTFANPTLAVLNFGQAAGWSSDNAFHRELADINGDGRADIVGFGIAGTWVSLAQADGSFTAPSLGLAQFGSHDGWANEDGFARTTGDINGDGKADLIGFGYAGTWVSLGNGDGTFKPATLAVNSFGVQQGWTSDNSYHRVVADVNGDGKDDIIGFGQAGVWVALSHGDGTFGDATLALDSFGQAQGWTSQDAYTRVVGDINGDGRADIVGFGANNIWVAYGKADGTFTPVTADESAFSQPQGWTSDNSFHRELADINHDGSLDIVGFGYAGVWAGLNHGDYFA